MSQMMSDTSSMKDSVA